ncbi:MAG: DUF4340 domain-containing protein [Bacteroidetes bacterium]|nr:DUF4340 domain-containing protein [Bacteroidota bacterium]
MKRNLLLLLALAALGGITWYFIGTSGTSTLQRELSDFAVEDTASITKIFIATKEGQQITLKRKDANTWIVNDAFIARPDAIRLLLLTIKQVEVRSPVGKRAYNNIIKRIAANGVKCEVYAKDELLKTYYVGGPNQDQLGTYMYLENSAVPFITHIPGFNGYLTPRYITNIYDWRDKRVFAIANGNIKQLQIESRELPNIDFSLAVNGAKDFQITDKLSNESYAADADKIAMYLKIIGKSSFEGVETHLSRQVIDSTLNLGWFRKITVTTGDGKEIMMQMYKLKNLEVDPDATEPPPNRPIHDKDRFLARINEDSLFVLAQYQMFDKLFQKPEIFK